MCGTEPERFTDCERCGEPVDTLESGVWKSTNDEQWWHAECYDKIEKARELAEKIRTLMVPEGESDGFSDDFHDHLDNAQSELELAVEHEELLQEKDLVTDGGVDTEDDVDGPYWCPYCEAVIVIDGEIVTREADAYWHTYDHQDVAPYAVMVLEEFETLDTVSTEHKPTTSDVDVGAVDGGP